MQINNIFLKEILNKIDGIIDSKNGYVKFIDGTMICYGSIETKNDSYTDVSFPENFIDIPSINLMCVTSDENFVKLALAKELNKSGVSVACMYGRLGEVFTNFGKEIIKYIAIGRWK